MLWIPSRHEWAINRVLRQYRLEGIETIISLHARLLGEDALHLNEYQRILSGRTANGMNRRT